MSSTRKCCNQSPNSKKLKRVNTNQGFLLWHAINFFMFMRSEPHTRSHMASSIALSFFAASIRAYLSFLFSFSKVVTSFFINNRSFLSFCSVFCNVLCFGSAILFLAHRTSLFFSAWSCYFFGVSTGCVNYQVILYFLSFDFGPLVFLLLNVTLHVFSVFPPLGWASLRAIYWSRSSTLGFGLFSWTEDGSACRYLDSGSSSLPELSCPVRFAIDIKTVMQNVKFWSGLSYKCYYYFVQQN